MVSSILESTTSIANRGGIPMTKPEVSDLISIIRTELEESDLIKSVWYVPGGLEFKACKGGMYKILFQIDCPGLCVGYFNPRHQDYEKIYAPNGMKYWTHEEIMMMFMTTMGSMLIKCNEDEVYRKKAKEFAFKAGIKYGVDKDE